MAGLFVVGVLLYAPCRSVLAYHWDGAQFALAVRQYDLRLSLPHAPGYFLYVMLGRLVDRLLHDPHASLQWVSVVAAAASGAGLYALGTALAGRRAGLAGALFLVSSPQVWFHGCVVASYAVDAVLVVALVFTCWRAIQRGGTWGDAVLVGGLVAVIGGVRQQTVPMLVPLVLFTFWRVRAHRWPKLLLAAAVALAGGVAWFVPMVRSSGGLAVYLDLVRRHAQNNAAVTWLGGGWPALADNVAAVTVYNVNGLLLAAVVLVGGLLWRVRLATEAKARWDAQHADALRVLAAWVIPMMVFGTLIGFTSQPGYVLGYLPALVLLAGMVAAQVGSRGRFLAVTAAVVAVNVFAFLAWPPGWDSLFGGAGRTRREIRRHDRELGRAIAAIRAHARPADTIVVHRLAAHYLFGLRHFELHLPEFDHYQLAPDPTVAAPPGAPLLASRDGWACFVGEVDTTGKRNAVLIVPPGLTVDVYDGQVDLAEVRVVAGSDGTVYQVPAEQLHLAGF